MKIKKQGRPENPLPEGPMPITKIMRTKILKDMVNMLCDAIDEEIKNDNSSVYDIVDTYVDKADYDIGDEDVKRIRKTYKRELYTLLVFVKDLRARINAKNYAGGRPVKGEDL